MKTKKQTAVAKTVLTTWNKRTYDVWGNKKDGYEVNDTRGHGSIDIRCKVQTHNPGTPQQFNSASPSDHQLKQIFGVHCAIDTDGDDLHIYVNRSSDSYPIGELLCESHESLSPIREVGHIQKRLEYLRGELRAERISLDELHELQSLAAHIPKEDIELREAAGIEEGK